MILDVLADVGRQHPTPPDTGRQQPAFAANILTRQPSNESTEKENTQTQGRS